MLRQRVPHDCGYDIASLSTEDPEVVGQITYRGFRLVLHPGGMLYVHEVYYDRREAILCISVEPTTFCNELVEEMQTMLEDAVHAVREPVLDLLDWMDGNPSTHLRKLDLSQPTDS